jgi:hypothetical protein
MLVCSPHGVAPSVQPAVDLRIERTSALEAESSPTVTMIRLTGCESIGVGVRNVPEAAG